MMIYDWKDFQDHSEIFDAFVMCFNENTNCRTFASSHVVLFASHLRQKHTSRQHRSELPELSLYISQKFPQHRSISTEWAKAACSELVEHRMWASIVHHQKWTKALTLMVIFGAVRSGTKGYVLGISMIQGISWFKWNLKLQHIAKNVTNIIMDQVINN